MPPRYISRPVLYLVGAIIVLAQFIPLPYVAIVPGPAFNLLGSAITINPLSTQSNSATIATSGAASTTASGAKNKANDVYQPMIPGKLFATTVMVTNPQAHMYAPELLVQWLRGDATIQPRSAIYPNHVSSKVALAQGKSEMVSAEKTATIAAANFLQGIDPATASFLSDKTVHFAMKETGGPSAGLGFALALIARVKAPNLFNGRSIAVTGTIDASGKVGPIGGIDQKSIGAARAGASIFIIPAENCLDISQSKKQWEKSQWKYQGMRIIPVASLTQAIHTLATLAPGKAGLSALASAAHC